MSFARRVPLPLSALALALATLGNLLVTYSPAVRAACGVASGLLIALVVLRIAFDAQGVWSELSTPAVLSIAPTFPMTLMVLSTYIKPLVGGGAFVLWAAALALQFGLVALFASRHLLDFHVEQVLPSWFLVFVGFVVASVTSPAFSMQPLGSVLLYAGLAGYVAGLALLAVRLVRHGDLPTPALPTIAIVVAPPSLCLAAYLTVAETKQPLFVYALLAAAMLSLLYVLVRLPSILRTGFHPGFAALTFPTAITAVAVKMCAGYFAKSGAGPALTGVVWGFEALAVAAVLYVLARYVMLLAAPSRT